MKYGFWFLLWNDHPKLCISKAGRCWDTDGEVIDLAELYHQDRRIQKQVGFVLGLIR